MKRLMLIAASLLLCLSSDGAPAPYPVKIDAQSSDGAPDLVVRQANQWTFRVSFKDNGTKSDITGQTPYMAWFTNDTAAIDSPASYVVVNATNGVVDFTFSPASLNYAPGRWRYAAGVIQTNGNYSTYRTGWFTILGDPHASGAAPIAWTTNVSLATMTFSGQIPAVNVATLPYLPTMTNGTTVQDGVLNGTNGVYFVPSGSTNRYWILCP